MKRFKANLKPKVKVSRRTTRKLRFAFIAVKRGTTSKNVDTQLPNERKMLQPTLVRPTW